MSMKEGWCIKKLGDVCVIERGGSPRPINKYITEDSKGINWIKIGDAKNGSKYITSTKEKIISEGVKKSRYVYKGDLLLSNSMSFGHPYILDIEGCIHDGWLVIHDVHNTFIKDYLYYFLGSPQIYKVFKSMAVGGVVNNLNSEMVRNLKIAIPPIFEQKIIVAEFDKLNEILAKKREQLKELDRLGQAIFYDMFGDTIQNEKGWRITKLKSLTLKIGSGATPKGGNENYKDEGISLIRSLNVYNGDFKYKNLAFIDDIQAKALDNVIVQKNDVLLNITGASVARCCIVPEKILPTRVNQHVAILRVDPELLDYNFLCSLLISNEYQSKLLQQSKSNGATREALTKVFIESLEIVVPPLKFQRQFVEKIECVNLQKQKIKQSIVEVQQLLDYTMNKYFG